MGARRGVWIAASLWVGCSGSLGTVGGDGGPSRDAGTFMDSGSSRMDAGASRTDAGESERDAAGRGMDGGSGGADAAGGGIDAAGGGGMDAGGGVMDAGGGFDGATVGGTDAGGSDAARASADAGSERDAGTHDAGRMGGLAGPLRVSSNPSFFEDATGHAVVLAGSHTWNDLQDWGTDGTPVALDFDAYVRFLVRHGQNFTLLWRTELPKFCGLPTTASAPPDFTTTDAPWMRTGPGTASDGGPKFDLTRFNDAFFTRLRARVSALNDAGIWTGVYLFTGEWLMAFRCGGDGHPLTGGNNVNGVDDGGGSGAMDMTTPNAITNIEDAMVDHMIDTLNDLPNVLWIVSEEAAPTTTWWQGHMIAHVHAHEATLPVHHPVGLAWITSLSDQTIYDTDADWVAPVARISPTTSCGSGTPSCKVNVNDSDHSYFGMWNDTVQENRNFVWENFTRGNNVAFMDPYVVYYPREGRNVCPSPVHGICSGPDPRYDNMRDNFGYVVSYGARMDLRAMRPSTSLCSTGYCLAQTPHVGSEILVYAPDGGSFTVDLSAASGRTFDVEWFDPATGSVVSTSTIAGGSASTHFTPPAAISGDAVLYLVDSAGHA